MLEGGAGSGQEGAKGTLLSKHAVGKLSRLMTRIEGICLFGCCRKNGIHEEIDNDIAGKRKKRTEASFML